MVIVRVNVRVIKDESDGETLEVMMALLLHGEIRNDV